MQSNAKTVEQYLGELPEDRREAIAKVREVILKNLPEGYTEGMMWGMITYYVPLEVYPDTYNQQPLCYVALANQKNYMTVYLMAAYTDSVQEKKLRDDYANAGKKLDFGKSCLRFKKLDDLLTDTVGEIVASTPAKEFVDFAKQHRSAKK
jgi:hypothetical protein